MPNDPIGPGTKAWAAFDAALSAYAQCMGPHNAKLNPAYQLYTNRQHRMVRALRAAGASNATIKLWKKLLNERITVRDFDEIHFS
jgi:hypothetical protein